MDYSHKIIILFKNSYRIACERIGVNTDRDCVQPQANDSCSLGLSVWDGRDMQPLKDSDLKTVLGYPVLPIPAYSCPSR